jgi:hypothetical protein
MNSVEYEHPVEWSINSQARDAAVRLIQAHALGQTQCDQALTEHGASSLAACRVRLTS